MKAKQLGLRVLSTAAIMSIISSIAAPAFAEFYYLGELGDNESGYDIKVDENGNVTVNGVKDTSGFVTIRGGTKADYEDSAEESTEEKEETTETETTTIGESEPVTQEAEEETPAEEEPVAEEEQPEETEETEETAKNPKAEEETPAEDKEPEEETSEEESEEEQSTEKTSAKEDTPSPQITDDDTPLAAPVNESEPVAQNDDDDDTDTKETFTDKVIKVTNDFLDNLKITLENVKIKSKNDAAMSVSGSKNTTIELDGKNELDSSETSGHAGLEKSGTGTMTITDTNPELSGKHGDEIAEDARGSLTATGGAGGAGIGGKTNGSQVGNIEIDGTAKITAVGSDSRYGGGAGIGTGGITSGSFPSGSVSSITIGGDALVDATGVGSSSTGIGGSYYGDVSNITITDHAEVKATGNDGAGIGSGRYSEQDTTIVIDDNANVTAFGYTGIGSGSSSKGKVTIKIKDNATVDATSTGFGAAIGTGIGCDNSTGGADIIIGTDGATAETETVTISARQTNTGAHYSGAVIGAGGCNRTLGNARINITIQGGARINEVTTNNSGDVVAIGAGSGSWHRHYYESVSGSLTIKDDAQINNIKGYYGLGFGKSDNSTTSSISITGNAKIGDIFANQLGLYADTITIGDDNSRIKFGDIYSLNGASLIYALQNLSIQDIAELQLTGEQNIYSDITDAAQGAYLIRAGVDENGNAKYLSKDDIVGLIDNNDEQIVVRVRNRDKNYKDILDENGNPTYTLLYIAHGENYCTSDSEGTVVKKATCTKEGLIHYDNCTYEKEQGAVTPTHTGEEFDRVTPKDPTNHVDQETGKAEGTYIKNAKEATCTEDGYTGDIYCEGCDGLIQEGEVIPATGPAADENTVTAPELWVTAPDGIRQVFHVTQSGTTRTYTSPYNSGTLTGTMEILQYLQEQGVETIVFTTNQRTSRFAVADLLALVGEGDVFYLSHMDANEPTLLVVTNDHADLLG